MKTLIKNGKIIFEERIESGLNILIEDEKIVGIGSENYKADIVIDAEDNYISPGFIDMHTHGGDGYDFMDGTKEAFINASLYHMKNGTTTIVPTTLSSSEDEIINSLKAFKEAKKEIIGPEMLGLHLEGPYFAYNQRGAQDPRFIRVPKKEEYMKILNSTEDLIRWSIAPELEGALELGTILKERNIIAAIGHSDAMYDDIKRAISCGYSLVTHLYSGMSSIKRVNAFRVLGLTECSYLFDELNVEIIADGKHLPPELLNLIVKCKDNDKICLISDSLRCAGAKEGSIAYTGSKENGQEVIIEDGVAKMPDRTCFAGSICSSNTCIRTMYKEVGLKLEKAVKMMSINPARILKIDNRKGSLEIGKDADICIFNDEIEIKKVLCKGILTYKKDAVT